MWRVKVTKNISCLKSKKKQAVLMGIDLTNPDDLDWIAEGRRQKGVASEFGIRFRDTDNEKRQQERLTRAIRDVLLDLERGASAERAQKAAESILHVLSDDALSQSAVKAWRTTGTSDLKGEEYMPVFYESWAKNLVQRYRSQDRDAESTNKSKRLKYA